MLLQPLVAKLAEGKIVETMFVEMGGVLARRLDGQPPGQGAVEQQHREVMHRVHGRHNAEEQAARTKHLPDLNQHLLNSRTLGITRLLTATATSTLAAS